MREIIKDEGIRRDNHIILERVKIYFTDSNKRIKAMGCTAPIETVSYGALIRSMVLLWVYTAKNLTLGLTHGTVGTDKEWFFESVPVGLGTRVFLQVLPLCSRRGP